MGTTPHGTLPALLKLSTGYPQVINTLQNFKSYPHFIHRQKKLDNLFKKCYRQLEKTCQDFKNSSKRIGKFKIFVK